MILNGVALLEAAPLKNMETSKKKFKGVSYGLSEAGYDIRVKQDLCFLPKRFLLASSIEEFQMPDNLVCLIKDKSTWARQGLSVFNTVVEPGWKGFLTLELVYHGDKPLKVEAGSGIAQALFNRISEPVRYNGKYQNQEDKPVESIWS